MRLADIDGSGPMDVIYLGNDETRVWFNQSGNDWSDPETLTTFVQVDEIASIQVLDLLGNGTSCLVWSTPLPGEANRAIRYIDLMGSVKPHLMTATRNNLGKETRYAYAPSTKFYLEDRAAGRPWVTKLPVFQCVRGNTGAASAALALHRARVHRPEPGIAKTPRGEIGITHRIVLMMDPDAEMPESWSTVPMTPRARANPILEAWVAGLLGDPAAVLTLVDFFGKRDGKRELFVRGVTLADLKVRGLDVLWLARHFDPEVCGSELEQRVLDAVRAAVAEDAARGESPITELEEFVIRWERSEHPPGATTFAEAMELARAIGTVIGNARALRPEDLGTPQTVVDVDHSPDASPPSAELTSVFSELEPAMLALKRAIEGQNHAELHRTLATASLFGVPGAYPSSSAETPQALAQLTLQATSVVHALAKRIASVPATANEMMKQCFGEDMLLVAARGEVPAGFEESLARSEEIGATAPAIGEWMRSVGRVRPAVARWERLAAYLHGLDRRAVGARVAQTPADGKWAALPPAEGGAIAPNTVATAVLGSAGSGSVCGLWLDEWVEVVPAATTDAALAVHYDDAGAEAGQCVLVAVAPGAATGWAVRTFSDVIVTVSAVMEPRIAGGATTTVIVPSGGDT